MPPEGGNRTPLSVSARFSGNWSVFSPGLPVAPIGSEPVRAWDFQVGQNTIVTPRSYEPFGFPQLRAFSNVELVRLAIETRKDQVERFDWSVKPRKIPGRQRHYDRDGRIAKIEQRLRRPDGVTPFATWLRLLLEDLLALDAPAIERRRNLGGEIIGYDVVDGATIKALVDQTGRRPVPPDPAFQQVIKGVPWADLTTDDLIYCPRNPRPGHLYGLGPVEQIIVTLTTVMQRQGAQLAYFTEGNTPAGILNAPEGWTKEHIKDFQTWFEAKLAGNTAERSKLLWVPAGTKYAAFKESPIKDEFDEWLARIVAFAFSLPPTPFVKQLNRATAEEGGARALEEGLQPILRWVKRLIDGIIQDDLGHPDLEFVWEVSRDIDPKVQAEIDDKNLKNGSETLDEVRDRRGQDPYPNGVGAVPRIYTATGAVDLASNDALTAASVAGAVRTAQADPKPADKPEGDDGGEGDDSTEGAGSGAASDAGKDGEEASE